MAMERLLTRSLRRICINQLRRQSAVPSDELDTSKVKTVAEFEDTVQLPVEELMKGRLNEPHRRILMGEKPYDKPLERYHSTVRYKRRLLGRYGMEAAGVPAGVAWPTEEEVALQKEYERVAYPKTLQEHWASFVERDRQTKERIAQREAELEANMAMSEKWKEQLFAKMQKKQEELEAAQRKKEKFTEEVRRYFGYNMSSKDPRYQQMLEEKEEKEKMLRKEQRKKMKLERKVESERKLHEKILAKGKKQEEAVDEELSKEK